MTAESASGAQADNPPLAKWPLMFVTDANCGGTDWMVLHAPIQSPSRKLLFADYRRRGFAFIGMSSFMTFPAAEEPDSLDYAAVCQGWGHCFQDPDRFLPPGQPRALLSLSDFTDPALITPHRFPRSHNARSEFDFVYVGADQDWKMEAKNWSLAERCLPRLCGQLGLRGLVVGVDPQKIPVLPRLTASPWLPYERFLQVLADSRFLFVPNVLDASPRVLAEALCLDVPVLVNRALLGGWKYVAASTGVFFEDEQDVTQAAQRCLNASFRPRSWYLSQFGPQLAGLALRNLVKQIEPTFTATGPLGLSYALRPCFDGAG
jgi:glycosyltransferase involved in cell wall biosynthesis